MNAKFIDACNAVLEEAEQCVQTIEAGLDQLLVSDNERREQIYRLESCIKGALEKLFGKEGDAQSEGLIAADVFGFQAPPGENEYARAAIFNYWSNDGEPVATAIDGKLPLGKWKDNVFYKGIRWSDRAARRRFYKYFNPVKDRLGGNAPVDYFTRIARLTKRTRIRVAIAHGNEIIEGVDVHVPVLLQNDAVSQGAGGDGDLGAKLMREVSSIKRCIADEALDKALSERTSSALLAIDESFAKVSAEITMMAAKSEGAIACAWEEMLSLVDQEAGTVDVAVQAQLQESLFAMCLAAQLYDYPFIIDMFFSGTEDGGCFILTYEGEFSPCSELVQLCERIGRLTGRVAAVEQEVWNASVVLMPVLWKWRRHYEHRESANERLANVVAGLCQGMCSTLNVKVMQVPSRVKTFDSLFEKLIKPANGRAIEDKIRSMFRASNVGERDDDDDAVRQWWRGLVMAATTASAQQVLSAISDVVGVRIVCLFHGDKEYILEEFRRLRDDGYVRIRNVKEYGERTEYRSIHVVIEMDEAFLNPYDRDAFRGKVCEVQIRSVLEHGWADVSHMLIYKSGLPAVLVERVRRAAEGKDMDVAATLAGVGDEKFGAVRRLIEKLADEGGCTVDLKARPLIRAQRRPGGPGHVEP